MLLMSALMLLAGPTLCAQGDVPWWKQQKIRFMWGQWNHAREDRSAGFWDSDLPRDLFRNVALAGGTVFVECRGYKPNHARFAHEFGMKYFATRFVCDLSSIPGRKWVKEDEEHWWPCPLDETVYEKWLVEPHLEGVKEGLIDGIHVDWEAYGGRGEAGICYCDDCFSRFIEIKGIKEALPDKAERFVWLASHGLVQAYEENFHQRRVEMFTRLREKLHAAKPDLLFSSYGTVFSDFTRAMNTAETPFIFLDSRHYMNDDRQAWWESYGSRLREEGYLYIPGGWTNSLFGAQASQVNAARWIYETSVNEDGCWLWFERELDDEILRAYATADREIRAVQAKVGDFLFDGKRDSNFVTAVEWTGRPELQRAVIHQTYHSGNAHLVHVNNVDTQWPVRVRLRFPRLAEGNQWTVREPMDDLYYTRDGTSAEWTREDLLAGVVVALEPRSDLFLVVSPAHGEIVDPSGLVHSSEFDRLPGHASASEQGFTALAADRAETRKSLAQSEQLVYTASEPMGFEGPEGGLTIGSAIRTVDARWKIGPRLRQLRGHLWSPRYSPDGRKIAFVHDAGGRGQIYVMNEDGTEATIVSDNAFCDRSPRWSPDGKTIAFVSDRTGDWDIYAMKANGSEQRRLAGNPGLDRAPAWSPDGERLAWESHISGMPNIWVADADGGRSQPLVTPEGQLKITEGNVGKNEVFNFAEVAWPFADNTFYLMDPVWSPDGGRIAAVALGAYSAHMVVVLDADGSRMLQVIKWLPSVDDLAWSPDGRHIAGTWRTAPQETERSGIFVVKDDGTDKNRYGQWLVDVTPTGPRLGGARRHGLMSWYSHGSAQPRRVVKTFTSVAWSPDGKTLAFSSDMDESGAFYLYTIPAQGGEPTRIELARSAWSQEIMWRPR
jgi:WD40 repeat protein